MPRDGVERVRFVVLAAGSHVGSGIDHQLIHVWLVERFDPSGEGLVGEDDHRRGVFAGQFAGFEGDVETVFDVAGGEDDARSVPMRTVDGLHEVGLFDVGGEASGRAAALDVDDDERELGHAGPAERFHLERETGTGTPSDGEMPGVGETDGVGDGGQFVFSLHEESSVFLQFTPEVLHDGGPGSDRVTGTVADTGGEKTEGERGVTVGGNLGMAGSVFGRLQLKVDVADVVGGPGVAGIEGQHGVTDDVLAEFAELLIDELGHLGDFEIEETAKQSQHEDVFALFLGRTTDRFDRGTGNRNAHGNTVDARGVGRDVVAVVDEHAAFAEGANVVVETVSVEGDEEVGLVAGA